MQNKSLSYKHLNMTSTKNEEISSKNIGNGSVKPKNPTAKKFLFVSEESLSGDLAWQIKKEGHEVKVYIDKESDRDVYDGFLDKVNDWKENIDWADVIVFDDIGFGDNADSLRQKGKLVVGGSKYTDRLEEDREFGQEEMKKSGMLVLPHWDFVDFDTAIEFIKENPGRYVFKPSGNTPSDSKGILFLGQEDDGKDLIEILEQNKKTWAKKIKKFQLQKMAVGVEVAVGAFFNGEDFIYPVNLNFEHKKLFPGDLGPYCYSEDTEVLTKDGWKLFNNVTKNDEVASYNPENDSIFYEKPVKLHWRKYEGKMVHFKNRYVDFLVTPTHKVWARRRKSNEWKCYDANDVPSEFLIKQSGVYEGKVDEYFLLPEYIDGRGKRNKRVKISMENWAEFIALYLSEGYVGRNNDYPNFVMICQKQNSPKKRKIKEILSKLPFSFTDNEKGYKINSSQLANYCQQFGLCHDKFVPNYIKTSNCHIVNKFLDAFLLGDGDLHYSRRRFHSGSWQMISDIQEMLTKIGSTGVICKDKRKTMICPTNKRLYNAQPVYSIEEATRNEIGIRKKEFVDYNGYIGCVTLKTTKLMFVRRNGRVGIFHNTGEMGTSMFFCPPNELFRNTLFKIRDKLTESGYVGYIDINCIANAKGIYPLEFTARFGYPTISIHMEGVLSEWGDFLYKIASGEEPELKTKKGFQIGVCVVVPPFPFDDKKESFIYKDLSILFRKPNLDGVHLGDVKKVNDVWVIAGDSGYVLVITGAGLTLEEARKQCYSRVKNIILQNMYYRTDIGLRWLLGDSDKLMTWGYLY